MTKFIIPYNESLSGTHGEIDLAKSRREFAEQMAKNYAADRNKKVTERMIESFERDSGAYHTVRDLVESLDTRNFENVVERFKLFYPFASDDWKSALKTGLVIKANEKEGHYSNGAYIFNDPLATKIRDAGINKMGPIIEEIFASNKYEFGGTVYNIVYEKIYEDGKVSDTAYKENVFAKDEDDARRHFESKYPTTRRILSIMEQYEFGGNTEGDYFVVMDNGEREWYKAARVEDVPNVYFAMGVNGAEKGEVFVHRANALRPLFRKDGVRVAPMPQYSGKSGSEIFERGGTPGKYPDLLKNAGRYLKGEVCLCGILKGIL